MALSSREQYLLDMVGLLLQEPSTITNPVHAKQYLQLQDPDHIPTHLLMQLLKVMHPTFSAGLNFFSDSTAPYAWHTDARVFPCYHGFGNSVRAALLDAVQTLINEELPS